MRSDDEAFRQLVNRHGTCLLRVCRLYLGDMQLAEDAVQDTFIKAWRAMGEFRGESGERTWLVRIAITTCKNYRRSRWFRSVPLDGLPEGGMDDHPADGAVLGEIARLPRRDREVVILRYYQELTPEEIAGMLGISRDAVFKRLSRARARLKQRLEGWHFDE